jgi:hypothetical protein
VGAAPKPVDKLPKPAAVAAPARPPAVPRERAPESPVAEKPVARWLEVFSEPPGAAVYIDGRLAGYTPTTLRSPKYDFSRARTIVIKRPGFEDQSKAVPAAGWTEGPGRLTYRVKATLTQKTGRVEEPAPAPAPAPSDGP